MIDFPAGATAGTVFTAAGSSWRYDGTKWVAYGAGQGNAGRNLIHNSMFNIAQRGAGPFTTTVIASLDRWVVALGLDTVSVTQQPLSDADRAGIGDEAAIYAIQNTFVGNAGASSFNEIKQRFEEIRRVAGKTVTLSFWAKAASGAPKLGLNMTQYFGTGGSPSGSVNVQASGNLVTLSTTWARYSSTFTVPSIAGKVFGTNNDNTMEVRFGMSAGSSNSSFFGGLGVQSGTIQLWGVQLEIGSVATPLEKPDPRYDLANCQRFYQTGIVDFNSYNVAGNPASTSNGFPVTMRATPSVTYSSPSYANASGITPSPQFSGLKTYVITTATGGLSCSSTYTVSADL